jgi:prepilin-type N-terminal cleavage/methylation domain-containing protein
MLSPHFSALHPKTTFTPQTHSKKDIPMLNRSQSAGFSLIELMAVVTIIGILAAIAIPSYQNYTRRARFAEVMASAEVFKTAVAIALQQGTDLAKLSAGSNGIPDSPKSTKNLASIKVENGIITATGSELVNNATYILQPNNDGSAFSISGTCLKHGFCNA